MTSVKLVTVLLSLCFVYLITKNEVGAAPLAQNKTEEHHQEKQGTPNEKPDIDLPYGKYVKEVMEFLEQDPAFKKYLETAKEEDLGNGRMARQLQFVSHHIRNKLDEVKRVELQRLKTQNRRMHELSNGVYSDGEMDELGIDRSALGRPLHVDVRNPHTFEVEDLMKLIKKTTDDLEQANKQRREEFKEYEMAKEFERKEKLRQMDEEHRKLAEKEHEEQLKKHKQHPKLHHPGSKQQLEEVWEKEDHMPTNEFDPLTFFAMHDINGDGALDPQELEAIFVEEVDKMYNESDGDDMVEKMEELSRMREHVMNEVDTNRDGMIDRAEFMAMVNKNDFNTDPGWTGIDEQQVFNEQEFEAYQKSHYPPGYQNPPVYMPPGNQYPYAQPNVYPPQGQAYNPSVQGNHIDQNGHYPQYPQQGNQQFVNPQYPQQGNPQFANPQFQQGNQQYGNPQLHQGNPQFQQGNPQGNQQFGTPQFQGQPQFQQGNQIPQFQQSNQQVNSQNQQVNAQPQDISKQGGTQSQPGQQESASQGIKNPAQPSSSNVPTQQNNDIGDKESSNNKIPVNDKTQAQQQTNH